MLKIDYERPAEYEEFDPIKSFTVEIDDPDQTGDLMFVFARIAVLLGHAPDNAGWYDY